MTCAMRWRISSFSLLTVSRCSRTDRTWALRICILHILMKQIVRISFKLFSSFSIFSSFESSELPSLLISLIVTDGVVPAVDDVESVGVVVWFCLL